MNISSAISAASGGGGAGWVGAGALSLLGGYMGNEASARQARYSRDFQERMSSTAHQREVADLKAAGLNPVLSGMGGHGASTPSGGMAPQSDIVTPAISSAQSQRMQNENIRTLDFQRRNIAADTGLKFDQATASRAAADASRSDAFLKHALAYKVAPEIESIGADVELARSRTQTEGTVRRLNEEIASLRSQETRGQALDNQVKELALKVIQADQAGRLDAAFLNSSEAGWLFRRSQMLSGGVGHWAEALGRVLNPKGYGPSPNSARSSEPIVKPMRTQPDDTPAKPLPSWQKDIYRGR